MAQDLIIWIDGASAGNPGKAALGIVIQDAAGNTLQELGEALTKDAETMTNNEAEYHALLRALRLAYDRGPDAVHIYSDSQLIVRQVSGQYACNVAALIPLRDKARRRMNVFPRCQLEWIPREKNARADALASEALGRVADPEAFNWHNFQRLRTERDRLCAECLRLAAQNEQLAAQLAGGDAPVIIDAAPNGLDALKQGAASW